MSHAQRLPPFVPACLTPILGHNSAFPSQVLSSPSCDCVATYDLKGEGSKSFSRLELIHDGGFHLSQPKRQPSNRSFIQLNQGKAVFNFVEINEPSGKPSSATQSQVKSLLMRKTHERRRNIQKSVKVQLRPLAASYSSLEQHMDTIDNPYSHSTTLQPLYSDSLSELKTSFSIPSQILSNISTNSRLQGNQDSATVLSGDIWCTGCGRLIIRCGEDNFTRYTEGPQTLLDTRLGDPFNSLPIPVTHRMHELIHHFIFHQQPMTNPRIHSGDSFLNLIQVVWLLSDPACIHTIVAQSCEHLEGACYKRPFLANGKPDSPEASHHIFEAVRLLNENLEDPKQALTNTTLLTVALLLCCSVFSGDAEQRVAHHKGMIKMINLRGGIDMLPRTMAHQMSRIDSMAAWSEQSKVDLPMYKSRFRDDGPLISALDVCNKQTSELFPDGQYIVLAYPRHSPFQNTKFEIFLWGQLFSAACELHGMTYMLELNLSDPKKIGPIQREYFEDTYAAVQRALISFPLPTDKGIIVSTSYYRQNCWRLAALLYFNTAIRIFPKGSIMLQSVVSALLSSLRLSDLASTWHPNSDILLWILFLGSFAAAREVDKSWFLVKIKHLVSLLDLESIGQLEALLQSFLYRELSYELHLRMVWGEIQTPP